MDSHLKDAVVGQVKEAKSAACNSWVEPKNKITLVTRHKELLSLGSKQREYTAGCECARNCSAVSPSSSPHGNRGLYPTANYLPHVAAIKRSGPDSASRFRRFINQTGFDTRQAIEWDADYQLAERFRAY